MYGYRFNSSASRNGTGVNAGLDDKGRTALHFAVEKGNMAEVDKLLRIGAKADQQDNSGETPLFIAVRMSNLPLIEKLLAHGATFRTKDDNGISPFDAAVVNGSDTEYLDKLKELGACLEIPANDTRTALHTAIDKDAASNVLAYLVEQGIPVNAKDDAGRTALHFALEKGNHAALLELLKLGADPVLRDNQLETPLYVAARKGDVRAVDILLDHKKVRETINEYKTYQEGYTPLMAAALHNHPQIIEKLYALGGDVNAQDNQNRHSLFIAAEAGQLDAVRTLLKTGADVSKSQMCTANKSSIVHWVTGKNYADILLLLHRSGVDLNARDGSGQTALYKACDNLDHDKIKALLELGADPNIPTEFGKRPIDVVLDHYAFDSMRGEEILSLLLSRKANTGIASSPDVKMSPLHTAAAQGKTGAVKLLLRYNAPVDAPCRYDNGMTPYQMAAQYGHVEAAKALQEAGANLGKCDNGARSCLHYAVMGGNADLTDTLLKAARTDINAKDGEGRTPLHLACRMERVEVATKLLAQGAHPTLYDKGGLTPLHHAAEANADQIFAMMTANTALKIDINAPTRDEGMTALHLAVRDNHQMLVHKLLELGADPSRAAKNRLLPLHYAILSDQLTSAENLLAGLRLKKQPLDQYRDQNGWSLLHYAATRETPQMAAMLIAAGCSPAVDADTGDTPLHIAARAGRMAVVEYLVESKDADMIARNKNDETPLAVAMRLGRKDIADFLMQKIIEQNKFEPDIDQKLFGRKGPQQ